jgi:hypothetical protein
VRIGISRRRLVLAQGVWPRGAVISDPSADKRIHALNRADPARPIAAMDQAA